MKPILRTLGKTGIKVNAIGLGTMPLAIQNRPDKKCAIEVIRRALELGMDFIDTADVYCLDQDDIGYCERLISEALKGWPKQKPVIVATKGGLERPQGAWTVNCTTKHLKNACEKSLKALNTEIIDLYQLHSSDPNVPYSESIGALKDLQQAGKIRHIGISNVTLSEIKEAQKIVDVVSVQNRFNLFDLRSLKEGIIDYCEHENITFIPWSPVGGGHEKQFTASHPLLNEIGKLHNASPFQVALAWLLALSPAMLPIPGASKIESVESSAKALFLNLTEEEMTRLNKAFDFIR